MTDNAHISLDEKTKLLLANSLKHMRDNAKNAVGKIHKNLLASYVHDKYNHSKEFEPAICKLKSALQNLISDYTKQNKFE